jgi:hypothetical protein
MVTDTSSNIWTGIAEQWEPYNISVQSDSPISPWINFRLHRTIKENPETGEHYCDWTVYLNGEELMTGIGDVPEDEDDTEEIIDILNTECELGLY